MLNWKAGVEYDTKQGVKVDQYYATANPNIYACGDVVSPFKFTHSADWSVIGACFFTHRIYSVTY